MRAEHTKARGRKARGWRQAARPMRAGDWLRLCALIALIAAGTWAAARLSPADGGAAAFPVVINRAMTSNPSACFSVKGRYYDWLELLNTSDEAVSLAGCRLSDTPDQRGAFAFGDVTLPPRGSLIVYCAPEPEGFEGSQVFCGFKLSADGELVALSDGAGQLAQVLEIPAMAASEVYQRNGDGGYSVVSFQEMAAGGAVDLRPAYNANGVVINELMASNRTALTDGDGDHADWIELYNGAAAPVSLAGCALSDDDVNQRKWMLPDRTLQPGDYLLVFASGKDRREGELHANFKLSASGESVRLFGPEGEVLSWAEYDSMEPDASLSRLPDGTLTADLRPTPGFENTEEGARAALSLAGTNGLGLYINEVMACGDGFDWLELYNAGASAADLSGMGLSDSTERPRRWQFPEGASIPAGGYLAVALVGADDDAGEVPEGVYRADFGLAQGETAVLALPDGTLLDRVVLFEQHRNVSYGRAEGYAQLRYFAEATPGAKNADASYERKAGEVAFSQPGGQRAEGRLELALTSDIGAPIYYTTDGSDPTANSSRYTGPLTLTENTVVKAIAWRQDVIPSDLAVQSYILGANHAMRIVSVSGKRSQLNGAAGMLNTGVKGTGCEAFVEIYEPDGTRVIAQKCLMKLAGRSSRVREPQKAFSLRARKAYGDGKFRAALFSNRDYEWYKSFVLRASGQDARQTHMRDSILTSLAADTSVMYQETELAVVYVNGKYWGEYNMRERVSPTSIAQFEGWDDPDAVEIVEGTGATNSDYARLLRWVRSHDLSDEANLEKLRTVVDVENYLDYVALQIYTCNQDLNNVRRYRNPQADGRWRWVIFDLDLSFQLDKDNVTDWLHGDSAGSITPQDNSLFKALMKNATVRDYFLTRMGQLLATTFSAENVTEKIRQRYLALEPEMAAECKRWGWSLATWKRYGKAMVSYAQRRPGRLIKYLASDFHLSDAQAQAYFGEALEKAGQ